MTTASQTKTQTWTVVDIRRVVDSFAADFLMLVQSSAVSGYTRTRIDGTVADIKLMGEAKLFTSVDVILLANNGTRVRAKKYTVDTNAEGWTVDRPGNDMWPCTVDGRIKVIISHTTDWQERWPSIASRLTLPWSTTNLDTSHAGLVRVSGRQYSSNGWGLSRGDYE